MTIGSKYDEASDSNVLDHMFVCTVDTNAADRDRLAKVSGGWIIGFAQGGKDPSLRTHYTTEVHAVKGRSILEAVRASSLDVWARYAYSDLKILWTIPSAGDLVHGIPQSQRDAGARGFRFVSAVLLGIFEHKARLP